MNNITRRTLRVYTALTELKGSDSDDVLDALIPFFEPILSVMNNKIFDPHLFSAGVRRLYRWRFTGDIAEQFIPRLERKGFLRKETRGTSAALWTVQYQDSESPRDPSNISTMLDKIIDEFERFPPKITDLLSYSRTRDELKDILIRFLVSMDSHGEGAYAPQFGNLEPGGHAGEILDQLEEGGRPLDPNDRYMCARFVQHLMKRHREFIPSLTRLASIALLTEVVEDFLKPTHFEAHTDLTVVLDAPIALDFLGCSGKDLKDDITTIMTALKKIGAKIVVFPISLAEIQRNLRSMLALPADQRRGYTHNALLKKEIGLDFVTAVSNNPETALEDAGITVRQVSLETYPGFHRFFTLEQYEDFFSSILWGNLVPAREHDATCAALIMRLREGRQSSDVFKCRIVMVTRNHKFVSEVRKYCLQSRMILENQEGPVIHQRELATMAWLRTGLGADETIPRGHLVATCDRVLQVRPELRAALASQLAKLTPDRLGQFNLLMQDARSMRKLADQTLNNEAVVTSENAQHLLDVMRESTAEELREKHEAELQAEKAVARERQDTASSEIARLSEQLADAKRNQARLEERTERQIASVTILANTWARRIEISVTAVLIPLGVAGVANYFTGVFDKSVIWSIVPMIAGLLGVITLILTLLGRTFPGLVSLLNIYVRYTIKKQLSLLSLDTERILDRIEIKGGRGRLKSAPP